MFLFNLSGGWEIGEAQQLVCVQAAAAAPVCFLSLSPVLVLITGRWHLLCAGTDCCAELLSFFGSVICNWKREWNASAIAMQMSWMELRPLGCYVTAVSFNQAEERDGRRRWTYTSGKSTGLVLILLCKANMYSSINGHCRWSRRESGKHKQEHWITTVPEEKLHARRQARQITAACGLHSNELCQ